MLKTKRTTYFVKRFTMSNVYLSVAEAQDIRINLTTQEFMLYTYIKGKALCDLDPEELKTPNLAKALDINEKTLTNVKSSLKKKGYLVISHFRDADNLLRADVIIGKEEVALYNLGLKIEITDAKAYNQLLKKFPIDNPTLSKEERAEMVKQFNQYYEEHKSEFK